MASRAISRPSDDDDDRFPFPDGGRSRIRNDFSSSSSLGRSTASCDGRGGDGELFVVQVTFVCLFESEARTHALKKDEVGRPSAAAAPDGPNRRDGGEEELLTDLKLECLMAGRPDGEAACAALSPNDPRALQIASPSFVPLCREKIMGVLKN